MFGLSKRELEAKFKKSELILLAWRSQEMAYNMNLGTEKFTGHKGKNLRYDASTPEGLPDKFFDENGDLNLSRVTGEEAYRFFSAQGIHLPIMMR